MVNTRSQKNAPEGGWGYLICIGMALPLVCALATMPSFGLMFGDFLTDLGEETSAIALITSCFFCSYSFAGLFTHSLYNKFSIRSVGVAGGVIYSIGCMFTIFVTSVPELLITYGILQGAGFGLMVPTAYTTFNKYFDKRRVFMMSITQILIGISSMIFPIFIQILMDMYGFKGAMAIIAAISCHSIFGMLVMHPIEWHMKKEINISNDIRGQRYESIPEICHEITIDAHLENPTIPKYKNQIINKQLDLLKKESQVSKSMNYLKIDDDDAHGKRRRASSIPDIGNWTGAIVVSDSSERISSYRQQINKSGVTISLWHKIVNFLDLTLLKDFVYVNIVLGISFALYSDIAFFTIQPMYLYEIGYSKIDTALIVSIGASADLASRIILALASIFIKVKARTVYLFGAIFTIITRFAFLYVFDFLSMSIVTGIMGFLRTWVHVPLPLVFAEYLSQERFPSGYGLFMFLQGNITFIIGPIVGWIRDITKSYEIAFHCLTFFMILCAVPWTIEMFYRKIRKNQ